MHSSHPKAGLLLSFNCVDVSLCIFTATNSFRIGLFTQKQDSALDNSGTVDKYDQIWNNSPKWPYDMSTSSPVFLQIFKTMWPDVWTRASPRNICVFLVTFDRLRSLCQAVVRGSSCEISCRLPYTGTFFDSTSVVTMTHLDDCYHLPSPCDEKSNKCGKWMKVGYVQNLNLALISKRTHCSTLAKNSFIYLHVYYICFV